MEKNQKVSIEPLGIERYEDMIELWKRAGLDFHIGYRDSKPQIVKQIAGGHVTFYGASDGNKLIGSVLCSDDSRRGWINHIAVLPEYRKRGIAKRLIETAECHFKERGLKIVAALVEDHNRPSCSLFEKEGYEQSFPGLRYYTKREGRGV